MNVKGIEYLFNMLIEFDGDYSNDCNEALEVIHATKLALWLTRAERAKLHQRYIQADWYDGWEVDLVKWEFVERKCREKAEEYK